MVFCLASGLAFADANELLLTIPKPNDEHVARWGRSLASMGDGTFLVGSYNLSQEPEEPVYRIDAMTGQVIQTYSEPPLPDQAGDDLYGSGLALVNGYVMVGSYSSVGDYYQSGSVHVFDPESGAYLRTIYHPNPRTSGSFGLSIAPLGDLALVGTYEDNGSNGAAYIVDPSTGSIELRIVRPAGSTTNDFGSSIATIEDDVLIGGRSSSVYRFDAETGAVKVAYNDPTPDFGLFGYTIASAGDKVLVSEFKASGDHPEEGAFHVFDAATGELLRTVANPHPADHDWFGIEIEVYNDRYVLIGAALDSPDGAAYLYDLTDYSLIAEFVNPDPADNIGERFGENMAWVGGAAVISAFRDKSGEGTVYVYEGLIPEPASVVLLCCGAVVLVRKRTPYRC
jgi:outer membrane protein assembly factor BamB